MAQRSRVGGCLLGAAVILAGGWPAIGREPQLDRMQVVEGLPLTQASVKGKYRNLLRAIAVPQDRQNYTDFNEWGYYTGTEYYGYKNLPAGHWVYVYPRWYIWGEKVK
jgi:hypothetical protein